MKIIGFRKVDFEKEGRHIVGTSFFLSYPIERFGDGVAVEKVFVRDDVLLSSGFSDVPPIGAEIELLYDKFGKVKGLYSL